MNKPGSLNRQIAGDHYKGLKMEPYQFVMAADWDPLAFTILKRISRYKNKDGVQDLEKALHEIDIRVDLWNPCVKPNSMADTFTIEEYIEGNGFTGMEASALRTLSQWVYDPYHPQKHIPLLKHQLEAMIAFDLKRPPNEAEKQAPQ